MPTIQSTERVKRKLRRLLIGSGLEGLSQTELVQKCRTYHSRNNPNGINVTHINDILTDWKARGLAQCFDVTKGYSKKPTKIWRATVSIKSERL